MGEVKADSWSAEIGVKYGRSQAPKFSDFGAETSQRWFGRSIDGFSGGMGCCSHQKITADRRWYFSDKADRIARLIWGGPANNHFLRVDSAYIKLVGNQPVLRMWSNCIPEGL